jgi:hypothetical protein
MSGGTFPAIRGGKIIGRVVGAGAVGPIAAECASTDDRDFFGGARSHWWTPKKRGHTRTTAGLQRSRVERARTKTETASRAFSPFLGSTNTRKSHPLSELSLKKQAADVSRLKKASRGREPAASQRLVALAHNRLQWQDGRSQATGTKSYSPMPCNTRNTAEVSPAFVTRCGRLGGTEKVSPRARHTSSFGC